MSNDLAPALTSHHRGANPAVHALPWSRNLILGGWKCKDMGDPCRTDRPGQPTVCQPAIGLIL